MLNHEVFGLFPKIIRIHFRTRLLETPSSEIFKLFVLNAHLLKFDLFLFELIFILVYSFLVEDFVKVIVHVVDVFADIIFLINNFVLQELSSSLGKLKLFSILLQSMLFLNHRFLKFYTHFFAGIKQFLLEVCIGLEHSFDTGRVRFPLVIRNIGLFYFRI